MLGKFLTTCSNYSRMASQLQITKGLRISPLSKEHFSEATKLYTHFNKAQHYKLRIEQQYMNVYSNDISWLNTIIYDIGNSINFD